MSETVLFSEGIAFDVGDTELVDQTVAASFSTQNAVTPDDLQLVLADVTPADGDAVTVQLWSDDPTQPGGAGPGTLIASLATIQDSSLSTTDAIVDIPLIVPLSGVTLAADTRYWIVLSGGPNSGAVWAYATDSSGAGVGGEFSLSGGILQGNNQVGPQLMTITACYAAGTRILTDAGEVPVESLRAGDLVAVMREGGFSAVRWMGVRRVDCARHPRPRDVWPVRIAPGAFGRGRPRRELVLSPDHAVYIGSDDEIGARGVLIPVRHLLNGATIVQTPADAITYHHVELDRHDVLLAEGLAAELYLDTGNRAAFANGGTATMAHPDFAMGVWANESCAPLVVDGPLLALVRGRLRGEAEALGHTVTGEPDLHLIVDGVRVDGKRDGATYRFALPAGARDTWLMSRSAVPAEMQDDVQDPRRLGIAVAAVMVDGTALARCVEAGWHEPEPGWQWTNGTAALPCVGAREVSITLALASRYWRSGAVRARLARAA